MLRGYGCLWIPLLQWVLGGAMGSLFYFSVGELEHIGVLIAS